MKIHVRIPVRFCAYPDLVFLQCGSRTEGFTKKDNKRNIKGKVQRDFVPPVSTFFEPTWTTDQKALKYFRVWLSYSNFNFEKTDSLGVTF